MNISYTSYYNQTTFSNPNLQALALENNRVWGNSNIYKILDKSRTSNSSNASNNSTYVGNNVTSSGVTMVHASFGCQPRISSVIG